MREGVRDVPPKFLQIKQDDKFFSRLLSKESSKGGGAGEASFRVLYYGGAAGSIPFMWESQPGTPKHPSLDNSVPPLTPPPSYQLSPRTMKNMRSHSKPNFLGSLFSRKCTRKTANDKMGSFSSSSSLSYSSSSQSMPSTPMNKSGSRKKNGLTRSTSAVQFQIDDEDEQNEVSPTSTLCFGGGIRFGGGGRPMKKVMKRAFLSISGQGTPN
ncbi:OLC1v1021927C1 [Oldenlandia corymbosa var. corymbosa]|uniref:OLC1v1021927C1 n=1 Tax=Oldenlandia corymbosa var. corymbosa TaxID=529605 RepID=A0AAV1C8A7_OLDCO|nr:OLC1v1021927C1 [Oldenlandia corymbosa var. corymbosa]